LKPDDDLVSSAKVDGRLLYHGVDLYGDGVDPIEVGRASAWCFSGESVSEVHYDNVAYGPAHPRMKDHLDDRVEQGAAPRALWTR